MNLNLSSWNPLPSLVLQVKTLVSQDNNRFREDGYDIDLTYITNRLIAMSLPAENFTATYRNSLFDVERFFKQYHPGHYLILNLSGIPYDYTRLDRKVLEFPFMDHHPPPLELLQQIIQTIDSWLLANEKNVVAVHCKAGRGRTGVVLASYLMFVGMMPTADTALAHFATRRARSSCVEFPSQRRFVRYFGEVIRGRPFQMKRIRLEKLIIRPVPNAFYDLGQGSPLPFLEIRSLATSTLLYSSHPAFGGKPNALSYVDNFLVYSLEVDLVEDVLVRLMGPPGLQAFLGERNAELLRVCFNTAFVASGFLDLSKDQIDFQTHKNSFPDDLIIRMVFSEPPLPSSPVALPSASPSASSSANSSSSIVVVEDVEFEKISSSDN